MLEKEGLTILEQDRSFLEERGFIKKDEKAPYLQYKDLFKMVMGDEKAAGKLKYAHSARVIQKHWQGFRTRKIYSFEISQLGAKKGIIKKEGEKLKKKTHSVRFEEQTPSKAMTPATSLAAKKQTGKRGGRKDETTAQLAKDKEAADEEKEDKEKEQAQIQLYIQKSIIPDLIQKSSAFGVFISI